MPRPLDSRWPRLCSYRLELRARPATAGPGTTPTRPVRRRRMATERCRDLVALGRRSGAPIQGLTLTLDVVLVVQFHEVLQCVGSVVTDMAMGPIS